MEVVSFLLAPETKSTFKKSKRRFQKTTPFLKNSLSGRLLTNGADTHTNISDHILILRLPGEQKELGRTIKVANTSEDGC